MYCMVFVAESGRVVDLEVTTQSSSSLLVHWVHPAQSNGLVQMYLMRYRLTGVGDCPLLDPPGSWSRLLDVDSNDLQAAINDLLPYSHYQVKVWARTAAGRGKVGVAYANTAAAGLSVTLCLSVCLSSKINILLTICVPLNLHLVSSEQ